MASRSPRWRANLPRAPAGAPPSPKFAKAGAVAGTITLSFTRPAPTTSRHFRSPISSACADKNDKGFFQRHFDGKVVVFGTVLDVEDRKITSARALPRCAKVHRAERCALTTPTARQTFIRNSISGVYVQATAVNNLLRGDALTEFGRTGAGIASLVLAALAVAAALALGPMAAALTFLVLRPSGPRERRSRSATRWWYRWPSPC